MDLQMSMFFGTKKLKMPMKQASEMSDEELLAQPEKGIEEEGWLESFERMLNRGEDIPAMGMTVTPGKLEKSAEKSVRGILGKLKKPLPREQMIELGEKIRMRGAANVTDESGKLVGTIGDLSDEGKALKQLAKEELERVNSAAPVIRKGPKRPAPKP
jgi:hypothetical protein